MWKAAAEFSTQTNQIKQVSNLFGQHASAQTLRFIQGFADEPADSHARVEGGIRILEDNADTHVFGTSVLRTFRLSFGTLYVDLSGLERKQPQQGERKRCLAASGFTHDG